jgi:hypothetical protein
MQFMLLQYALLPVACLMDGTAGLTQVDTGWYLVRVSWELVLRLTGVVLPVRILLRTTLLVTGFCAQWMWFVCSGIR